MARVPWFPKPGLINDIGFIDYHPTSTKGIFYLRNQGAIQIIKTDDDVVGGFIKMNVALKILHVGL